MAALLLDLHRRQEDILIVVTHSARDLVLAEEIGEQEPRGNKRLMGSV